MNRQARAEGSTKAHLKCVLHSTVVRKVRAEPFTYFDYFLAFSIFPIGGNLHGYAPWCCGGMCQHAFTRYYRAQGRVCSLILFGYLMLVSKTLRQIGSTLQPSVTVCYTVLIHPSGGHQRSGGIFDRSRRVFYFAVIELKLHPHNWIISASYLFWIALSTIQNDSYHSLRVTFFA